MIVTRAEVDAFLGVIEEPDPPRRIGFCGNPIDILFVSGKFVPVCCSAPIDDQDLEALELPPVGKRRQFCCGPCLDKLLFPRLRGRESTDEKTGPKKAGDHYRSPRPPQVHKGEDLK